MRKITVDYSQISNIIEQQLVTAFQERINLYHEMLHKGTGYGSDYLGWVDWPHNFDRKEFAGIKAAAQRIRKQAEVLIIVGIGGSYLGARAAIEMLCHTFHNELPKEKRNGPKIYYAGHNISTIYIKNLLEVIAGQDVSIIYISKSGETTEPAIVFRLLKEYMKNKYGKQETANRIYVTTDKSKGILKSIANQEGYESFVLPDNVGGRYSVLTPAGLLPMAVAGIDIDEVMKGGQAAAKDLAIASLEYNMAYQYAVIRNILYSRGKTIELMVSYEPNFFYFGEWFKQLFAESEGKDGKGIFPAFSVFPTDLHSVGQYLQDGRKHIFETVLNVEKCREQIMIGETGGNADGLNYLKEKTLEYVNKKTMEWAIRTHVDGGVPNLIINIPEISPYYLGYLVYFFEKACGMSGCLFGVNPFDQPGVDAYKTNMFRLLGKPGYE